MVFNVKLIFKLGKLNSGALCGAEKVMCDD